MSIEAALSIPGGSEEAWVSEAIAKRAAERSRSLLLNALSDQGALELLRAVEGAEPPDTGCWRPEVGLINKSMREGNYQLAALGWLCSFGFSDLSVELAVSSTKLFLDGCARSISGPVRVVREGDNLTLISAAGTIKKKRFGAFWTDDGYVARSSPAGSRAYLFCTDELGVPGQFPDPCSASEPQADSAVEGARGISRIIDALINGNSHGEWIASVARGVMIAKGKANLGGADPRYPGLIATCWQDDVVKNVEWIVDAIAQQKMFQLAMVFPLTEGGREEIHYLPSRRSYLTTRRIIATAHQHVNAIRILRNFDLGEQLRGAIEERVSARLLLIEVDCFEPLEKSRSLSLHGKQVWASLRDGLF